MTNTNTKISKLVNALTSGSELTAKQITSRFGIANPTAAITGLRSEGYAVYHNMSNGVGRYRIGKPTRRMVAAGYASLGAERSGLV